MENFIADPFDRHRRIGQRRDLETFRIQEILKVLANVLIVVDYQDRELGRGSEWDSTNNSTCNHGGGGDHGFTIY